MTGNAALRVTEPSGPARPVLGIIVVNYGSSALLRAHLADRAVSGPQDLVVVVDNSADPAERAAVADLCDRHGWRRVSLPDNPGFGAGVNAGIAAAREAGCVSFLCLNPDAVVSRDVVDELRSHSLREPLSLISPCIVDSTGAVVFRGARLNLRSGDMGSGHSGHSDTTPSAWMGWLTGACLVVHQDLFERIGGFAEDYFLYWEDVDLSRRCLSAGGRLVVREDLVVVHDEGGTQGPRRGRAKSSTYYRYNCRNRLLFAAHHLSRREILGWLLRTPAASWRILIRGGRRQLLQSTRPVRATVRGSLEGMAVALRAVLAPRRRSARGWALVVHPGAELYGSDRMLLESVTALTASGRKGTVALPGDGPLVPLLRAAGAAVVTCPMPVLRKSALRPAGAARLLLDGARGLLPAARLVRAHRAVYVSTLTIPSWLVLARLLRRPSICHVHEAESSAPLVLRRALAVAPRLASRVLVNSRFSLGVLTDVAPGLEERSALLLNGVAGPETPAPARTALVGPVELLFVGRLSPRKGPQVAVATLAELVTRGIDARLTLLGSVFDGYEWFEAELREAVRAQDLTDRVEFLGFRPQVWPTMAAADVVLIPSIADEPFGNTAVEAVLAARPVVVSRTSGLREAVAGYAGVQVVEPGEPAGWADAVVRAVDDWPTFRDAARADAERARLRHSPDEYRRRLVDEFAALAGTGAGSSEPAPSSPRGSVP